MDNNKKWTDFAQSFSSDDEGEKVRKQIEEKGQTDPSLSQEYKEVCSIWHFCGKMPKIETLDLNARLEAMNKRISQIPTNGAAPKVVRFTQKTFLQRYAVAASLFFALTFGLSVYLLKTKTTDLAVVTTQNAQQTAVTLPDGTIVRLNAGSEFAYPEQFSPAERRVKLSYGEAFFEVKRDEKKPFIVEVQGAETKVLGTSFNIIAYKEMDKVKLDVKTGKVAFGTTENNLIVEAGQAATFNKEEGTVSVTSFTESFGWQSGVITFNDEKLENIALQLSKYYDVKIQVASEIKDRKLTGQFRDKKLDEVLEYIKIALDVNIKREGKLIKIVK